MESPVREPSSLAISKPLHPPPMITTSTGGKVFILRPRWDERCRPQSLAASWLASGETLPQNAGRHQHSYSCLVRGTRSVANRSCRYSRHASDRRTCLQSCSCGGGKRKEWVRSPSAFGRAQWSPIDRSPSSPLILCDRSAEVLLCLDNQIPEEQSLQRAPDYSDAGLVPKVQLVAGRCKQPLQLPKRRGPFDRLGRFVRQRRQRSEPPIEKKIEEECESIVRLARKVEKHCDQGSRRALRRCWLPTT